MEVGYPRSSSNLKWFLTFFLNNGTKNIMNQDCFKICRENYKVGIYDRKININYRLLWNNPFVNFEDLSPG